MRFFSCIPYTGKQYNVLILLFLTISLVIPFSFIEPTTAVEPSAFPLKWTGYISGGGESLVTYDVLTDASHPGEEIFHAGGGAKPGSPGGSATCLNGRTGAVIWKTGQGGVPALVDRIGDTCQIQLVDMDLDGTMEVIVPLQSPAGLYILNAESGTIQFQALDVGGGRIDSGTVAGDVDKDGYPDLFVGIMGYEEPSPSQGSNGKVIRYEYDPASRSIVERNRVTVWHPCAGGLSLSDTDNDGTFELYMNERDAYFGDGSWGRGLTSFWAENLTVRWDLYDWGASSNKPMLGDVDHDGKIDVISTDLSSGVCVLNSTDGHPLKNAAGTTLMQTGIAGRHNHYQSSIYDIDGDGNLEVLSGDGFEGEYNYISVFDLYNWQLEADIDTTIVGPTLTRSWKGPTVGEVTGDGVMDIIVTTFDPTGTNNGQVQIYDKNYNLVYLNTGLQHRAIDSVVQDVDRNDGGLNELLILTQGGKIYCFDTNGIASNPRARSEVQFYSESRNGASEFVPYERPYPDVSSPSPTTGAVGVSTSINQLSFRLDHPAGQTMSYTVTTLPNIGSGSGINVGNGLRTLSVSGLQQNVTYSWHVRVTDQSGHVTNWDYYFTTGPYQANRAPTQDTPYLSGERDGDDLTTTPQGTFDPDGDRVTNIYNWQKGGTSIAYLNAPFNTKTNPQDEYSGLATTKDYAYGATGMVVGASWTPNGKVGGAYSFNGDDFIRFPETGTNNRYDGGGSRSEMSLEAWVKANTMTSTERVIWKQNYYYDEVNGQPWSYRLDCSNNAGALQFTWQVGVGPLGVNGTYTTYSTGPYQVTSGSGDWHHVVATYKSGVGLRLFVDGVEVKNLLGASITGNILDTDGPLEIAFRSGSDYNGLLDEVRLYPTAISQSMVAQRYAETVNGQSSTSTISNLDTTVGDQWRCQVTPNDAFTDGTTIATATKTIITGGGTQYRLLTNIIGNGSITITPDIAQYNSGTIVNITAIPSSGWNFSNWLLNGTNVGSTNPFSLTMSNNYNLTAIFTQTPIGQYTLHVQTNGQGTTNTTGDNQYPAGTQVRVLATPSSGWFFSGWLLNGSNAGSTNPFMLTMNSNYNLTAVFTAQLPVQYTLHVQVNGQGTTNATGDTAYNNGTTILVQANATTGFSFAGWLLNGTNAGTTNPYSIVMNNNYNITAVFTQNQSQHLFSDGFESGNFNAWTQTTTTTGGTVTVTQSQAYTGTYGANFAIAAGTGTRRAYTYVNIASQPNLYAKAYIYLPSSLSLSNGQSLWLIQFTDSTNSPFESFGLRADATGMHWAVQWSNYPYAVGSALPSGGGWYLVEAYFTHAPTGKTLVLNVNGVEAASLNQDTSAAANVSSVRFGVCYYPGSSITNLGVDDVVIDPQTPQPPPQFGLTIGTQGTGTTNPATGSYQYNFGSVVNVTANPGNGWQFSGWLLNGTSFGSSNPCTLTMSQSYNLTAIFTQPPPNPYNLHVQVSGSGTTNATGDASYNEGTMVTVVATPISGWSFDSWLRNGTNVGSTNPYTLNMAANYNLTAVFTQNLTRYQLRVQISGSGVTNATGDTLYNANTVVNVLATANTSSIFSNWLLDGSNVGSTNPYAVLMNTNHNLTAVFTQTPPKQYELHVQTSGQGITNATGDTLYNSGTQVNVLATPSNGWTLSGWTLNGTNIGAANPYSFTINANYNLVAIFVQIPPIQYNLHGQAIGQGTTNATGDTAYNAGTTVQVLATPSSGWTLSNWLLNGTNSGTANPYSLTMNNNYNLTAVFTQTPSEHLFSDGYESGNFNAWAGTTVTTGGSLVVNSANPLSGTHSGAYTVSAGTGVRRAYSYTSIANIPELYTQAYVYIPSTFTLANGQALWLIQYFNGATPLASYGVRADSAGMHWSVQYGNTPYAVGATFPTSGGWYLLEAYFTHASSGKTIVLYANGTELANLSQSTASLPNVNTVRIGIGYDAGTTALSIFVDDVTVDIGSPQIQVDKQVQYNSMVTNVDIKANNGKGADKKIQEFA